MSGIVKQSYVEITESYRMEWEGYSFDCDANGKIDTSYLSAEGKANLAKCESTGAGTLTYHISTYRHPAIMECTCGRALELADAMTNVCEHCGRDYNGFGQALVKPFQWRAEDWEQD